MTDFIQYHNEQKQGTGWRELCAPEVWTRKAVSEDVIGSRVWLVAGEQAQRHKRYLLCYVFEATGIDASPDPAFASVVRGHFLHRFSPPPSVGEQAWFMTLRERLANFSLGFSRVPDDVLPDLLALLEERSNRRGLWD